MNNSLSHNIVLADHRSILATGSPLLGALHLPLGHTVLSGLSPCRKAHPALGTPSRRKASLISWGSAPAMPSPISRGGHPLARCATPPHLARFARQPRRVHLTLILVMPTQSTLLARWGWVGA